METKINVYFCENCLIWDFINSVYEKGVPIPAQCSIEFSDSEYSDSDGSDDHGFDNDLDEMEQYKLRANSVFWRTSESHFEEHLWTNASVANTINSQNFIITCLKELKFCFICVESCSFQLC